MGEKYQPVSQPLVLSRTSGQSKLVPKFYLLIKHEFIFIGQLMMSIYSLNSINKQEGKDINLRHSNVIVNHWDRFKKKKKTWNKCSMLLSKKKKRKSLSLGIFSEKL